MIPSLTASSVLKQSYNSWHEVLTNTKNLNHRDRRKLIKKFKRSQKRRARAQQDESEKLKENEEENSDDDDVAVHRPLSCGQFLRTLLDNIKQDDVSELEENLSSNVKEAAVNDEENSCAVVVDEVKNSEVELNKEDELDDLLKQIDIEVKEWDNSTSVIVEPPSPPPQPATNKTWEAEPERNLNPCKFYTTVGACRYFENCKKDHVEVARSETILIISMFNTCGFEISERAMRSGRGSDAQDIGLEYTDENLYDDFEEFAFEVVPELEKFGVLKHFKVCCNRDLHLRGNVYVEFETISQAEVCYKKLNGRYFDGKQLNCNFVNITNWNTAVCGMHARGQVCPRGYHCNYLHVFPNPKSLLRRLSRDSDHHHRDRWSSSYDRHRSSPRRHSSTRRSPRRRHDTSPPSSRKRDKHEKKHKRLRSRSRESRERKSKKKSSRKDKSKSKKKRDKEKRD